MKNFFSWLAESFHGAEIYVNTSRGRESCPVAKLAAWAEANLPVRRLTIDWLRANVNGSGSANLNSPPEPGEDHDRSVGTDLSFPVLIVVEPGETWVGDGNHRIYKAMHVAKQGWVPGYVIDALALPAPGDL